MLAVTSRVACLCCGTSYDRDSDCPNVERVEHSLERAQLVARWLLANGIEHPTSLEVRSVLAIIDLHERADV